MMHCISRLCFCSLEHTLNLLRISWGFKQCMMYRLQYKGPGVYLQNAVILYKSFTSFICIDIYWVIPPSFLKTEKWTFFYNSYTYRKMYITKTGKSTYTRWNLTLKIDQKWSNLTNFDSIFIFTSQYFKWFNCSCVSLQPMVNIHTCTLKVIDEF